MGAGAVGGSRQGDWAPSSGQPGAHTLSSRLSTALCGLPGPSHLIDEVEAQGNAGSMLQSLGGRRPVLRPLSPSWSCFRLTAFVLKSFAQARSFIFIDPRELAAAKGWIIGQQRADGSFPAVGRILNKDIQVSALLGLLPGLWPSPGCSRCCLGPRAVGAVPSGSG